MAHKKAGGSSRNGRDSQAKRLGVKIFGADLAKQGLDVASVADVICELQSHYSTRAYRRDPSYPDSPALIDATIQFVLDAVKR